MELIKAAGNAPHGTGGGGQAEDGAVIAVGNVFLKVYDAVITHPQLARW